MAEMEINFLRAKIRSMTEENTGLDKGLAKDELQLIFPKLKELKRHLRRVESTNSNSHVRSRASLHDRVKTEVQDIHKVLNQYELDIAYYPSDKGLSFRRLLGFHLGFHLIKRATAERHLATQLQEVNGKLDKCFGEIYDMFPENDETTCTTTSISTRDASSPERQPEGHPPPPPFYKAVGLKSPVNKIVDWLVSGQNQLTSTAIVGMGGLGKTTLAHKVFNHTKVRETFDCSVWVTITRSFKLDMVFRIMIEQLCGSRDEESPTFLEDIKSLEVLARLLKDFLKEKKYLIVLDDVWSTDVGEFIKHKLPQNLKGSRILITTPLVEVAYTCATGYSFVHNHEPLKLEDAWALFCIKTGFNTHPPSFPSPKLESMAKEMVRRCSGLPLAIVILAGLLSTKQKVEEEWLPVIDSLMHTEVIINIFHICYDDLPDCLKPCFLYFGLFPGNYCIDRTRLIRMWLAEGFVETGDEAGAERYLNELIQRNLVYASELDADGRVRSCRVHETSHAIIVSKLLETNFGTKSSGSSLEIDQKSPRLSIQGNVEYLPKKLKSNNLFSIMVFNIDSWNSSRMRTILVRSRLLNVLDLTSAPLSTFPSEIPTLPYLKYLSLRDTKLEKLPNSIGKLKQLITLDLKGTSIKELPSEILRLEHLRYLLVHLRSPQHPQQRQGVKISFGLTQLRTLKKLTLIDVGARTGATKEIKTLTQLTRLGITNLPTGEGGDLCTSLEEMKQLESLSITPVNGQMIQMEKLSRPPPLLRRLYFHGSVEKLPSWISNLTNLAKMRLRLTKLKDEQSLQPLQELPNLKVLALEEEGSNLEELSLKQGFQNLKCLHLYHFDKLKQIKIEKGALPSLQKLYMHNCEQLKNLSLGSTDISELRELHLIGMPRVGESRIQIEDGEFSKTKPIIRSYTHENKASLVYVFSKIE